MDIVAYLTGESWARHDGSAPARPTQNEIARLAYEFYEERGRVDGHDLEDWLAAERELVRHFR
jgi:hypothetical protein